MFSLKNLVRDSLVSKNTVYNFFIEFGSRYPTPDSLTYSWNFGFLALFCLVFQIVTGVILSSHYIPDANYAFESVEMIMRETNYGYYIRYMHANGASFFFLVVYIHMSKALFQCSYMYPRQSLWMTGIIIYILMILTAFLGYVLPWGQMSFWAATVITSLLAVIPIYGDTIILFVLGDYSISHPTLVRFFAFHFFLPFVILFIALFHLVFLHNFGSNSKLGAGKKVDTRSFLPLFFLKDFSFLNWILAFFGILVFFFPSLLGHPDNYMRANPLITPNLIVPEWYFLPFYAVLKSVPDKAYGFLLLILAVLVLFFVPYLNKMNPKASEFQPYNEVFTVFFIFDFIALGFLGGQPYSNLVVYWSRWCTFFYFFYLLVILPWGSRIQKKFIDFGFIRWIFFLWGGYLRIVKFNLLGFKVFFPCFSQYFDLCFFSELFRVKYFHSSLSENFRSPRSDRRFRCALFQQTHTCMCFDTVKYIYRYEMRLIISERKKRHQYLRECLWQYIAEHYEIIEKTLDTDHFSEIIGIRFPSANAKVVSARVMFMMVTEGYVNINGIDVHPLVHLERMILVHGLDVDGPDFESMSKEVFSIMDEVSVVQHHPNFRLVKKSRYHLSSAKVTYSKAERFIVRKKRFFPRLENAEDKIDPRYLPTYDFFFHGIDKY